MAEPRVVHCSASAGLSLPVVYVGPPGRAPPDIPGAPRFASPFQAGPPLSRRRRYKELLARCPALAAAARRELRGKNLACWCPPRPCHAEVLRDAAGSWPGPGPRRPVPGSQPVGNPAGSSGTRAPASWRDAPAAAAPAGPAARPLLETIAGAPMSAVAVVEDECPICEWGSLEAGLCRFCGLRSVPEAPPERDARCPPPAQVGDRPGPDARFPASSQLAENGQELPGGHRATGRGRPPALAGDGRRASAPEPEAGRELKKPAARDPFCSEGAPPESAAAEARTSTPAGRDARQGGHRPETREPGAGPEERHTSRALARVLAEARRARPATMEQLYGLFEAQKWSLDGEALLALDAMLEEPLFVENKTLWRREALGRHYRALGEQGVEPEAVFAQQEVGVFAVGGEFEYIARDAGDSRDFAPVLDVLRGRKPAPVEVVATRVFVGRASWADFKVLQNVVRGVRLVAAQQPRGAVGFGGLAAALFPASPGAAAHPALS